MAYLFPVHSDDVDEIAGLRQRLIGIRLASGKPSSGACEAAGLPAEFMSRLETARRDSPKLSSLQKWAGALDYRVEFRIEDFWLYAHGAQEMLMWYAMSRPWGADAQMRQWLVSALGQWRVKKGMDVEDVAELMGVGVSAVRDWEADSPDPLLKRAMWQARVTGTRVRLDLWRREDWVYG